MGAMRAARTFMLVVFVVLAQGFHVTEGNLLKEVTTIATTTPIKCENGGLTDGIKCICPVGNVFGVRCELVRDRVPLGRSLDATIRVELLVTGFPFANDLNDVSSPSSVLLNKTLTELEKDMLPGYFQGIKITNVQNATNNIVVIHDVILRILFSKTETVADQYAKNYKEVGKILNTEKCQTGDKPSCIKGLRAITPNIPPTEKELCVRNISAFFVSSFDAVVKDDEGLSCVSQCDLSSPRYVNCTDGTCQIKKDGAECFCPNTDKYLYTYSRCRGAVLIVAMYGGVGAAIVVLVIVSVILGVFFYRKKYYY
ncbi:mucin-17-like isoform X1 [Rana temporaria]|uniref:mucin-17-like isoform X1 n=1 Tax=Rana temporaria TaxID=8407 RepID=UPI001AAD405B|nr:mucin-17-like isoform X1 [Rana temporaria]